MDFNTSVPIYMQIADFVKRMIVSGQWARGDKIPPVRELALDMSVNPNTVQKAVAFLEDEGLVHTERTSGRYVTQDDASIARAKQEMTHTEIESFMTSMRGIGYQDNEVLELFNSSFTNSRYTGGGKTNE